MAQKANEISQNGELDRIDRALLTFLQQDCTVPIHELAARVHLSSAACWKRIQRLKSDGVIRGQVALCDARRLGRGTRVHVFVRTREHSDAWLRRFAAAIEQLPEVVSADRLSGEVDYLLQVVVPDIAGYDRFYRRLIALVELSDVSSSFVMEQLKDTTAIPCDGG